MVLYHENVLFFVVVRTSYAYILELYVILSTAKKAIVLDLLVESNDVELWIINCFFFDIYVYIRASVFAGIFRSSAKERTTNHLHTQISPHAVELWNAISFAWIDLQQKTTKTIICWSKTQICLWNMSYTPASCFH